MLFLDASELMDNPGKVMREVAQFVGLPPARDIKFHYIISLLNLFTNYVF